MSRYSKDQEYRIAKAFVDSGIPAKRVPLSGACAAIGKGDVSVDEGNLLIDHKSTIGKEQITIHRKHLEKILEDAGEGIGAVTFSYKGQKKLWIIMDLQQFIAMYNLYRGNCGIIKQ